MISTVVVSYKRPELLRLTLESYLATVSVPYEIVVVDNGSCKTALGIARGFGVEVIELGENRFPGHSTNVGWDYFVKGVRPMSSDEIARKSRENSNRMTLGPPSLLHRSDNDVAYLPGWCEEVTRCFDADPNLGQLGLRTVEEEGRHPNVGGNCVVRAEVFKLVRWQGVPWQPGVKGEDYFFTRAVDDAGFNWGRVESPCIVHRGAQWPERPTDPYYEETWGYKGVW